MNQRQLEKVVKESIHEALEPFRLAYTEQTKENAKLTKALQEVTVAYAKALMGTPPDSK